MMFSKGKKEAKATQNNFVLFFLGVGVGGEGKDILSKKLLKYDCTALANKQNSLKTPINRKTKTTRPILSCCYLSYKMALLLYAQALPSFKKSGMRRKGNNHNLISTAITGFRNLESLVIVTSVIPFHSTEK